MRKDGEDWVKKCMEYRVEGRRPIGRPRKTWLNSVVVVVCPLQPSSSVNSGCPGPESSILVSSRWACPISSQVTDHWGELRNRTGEVYPVDPFHSLDILKNHSASFAFCRNLGVYNVQNGAVIELSFVVSVKGFPRHWWMEVDCSVLCYPSCCLLLY